MTKLISNVVIHFTWEGQVTLSEMDIQSILDLLETSRMMCLDSLTKGVKDYLNNKIISKKVELNDCFNALDFSVSHKLEDVSEWVVSYIDQNLESVRTLPRFVNLSECSMLAMLEYGGRQSKESVIP